MSFRSGGKMNIFRYASIKSKLIAVTVLTTAVVVVSASAAHVWSDVAHMRLSMEQRVQSQAALLAAHCSVALDFDNADAVRETLACLRDELLAESAVIFTPKGKALGSFIRSPGAILPEPRFDESMSYTTQGQLDVAEPIIRNGERLGVLCLRSNLAELDQQVRHSVLMTAEILFGSLLLCILISSMAQRFISKPILNLADATKDVSARGDYSVRVKKTSDDEIGELYDGFNQMLDQLQTRDAELNRHRLHLEDIVAERTRDLEVKTKEALAASVAKSEFLANMSHEIRTPMNGIIGLTQVMMRTPLRTDQREHLNFISQSADSLMAIINDILDFSKIEAGRLTLDSVEFELRDFLADTLRPLAVRAHAKHLELALRVGSEVPDRLIGDPLRLRQIITNLVGNALKFTEKGEIVVKVDLAMDQPLDRSGPGPDPRNPLIHMSVSDTGIGIPRDKQAAIFEPFTQADGSTTRRYGGTGLGLTICTRIVELMGGRLWVNSKEDEGSTFHITARFSRSPKPPAAHAASARQPLADLAVLVVDDNATNRRVMKEMLEDWGMRPFVVAGANEALDVMARAKSRKEVYPSLAVVDAKMPGLDGFQLADELQKRYGLADSTIMMLTSEDHCDAQKCQDMGIAAFLSKPIKQSLLYNTILDIVESSQDNLHVSDQATNAPSGSMSGRSARYTVGRLRILVAEDNYVNRQVAQHLIGKMGHEIITVNNGREALAYLEVNDSDIVLMDLQMPEMGGLEATAKIRLREATGEDHIPIVALTAHAIKGDKEKCLAVGMDGYLAKPIEESEILTVFQELLPLIDKHRYCRAIKSQNGSLSHTKLPLILGESKMANDALGKSRAI
jgi:signal transduction histidine kinase/DNA-binding response OmpR family regulator